MQSKNKTDNKAKQQTEDKAELKEDILNGHKKDCPGYEDIYRGIDCNCFDAIEDCSVEK